MGLAHVLAKKSSEWDRGPFTRQNVVDRQAYGPTHMLDKLLSGREWDRGPLTR